MKIVKVAGVCSLLLTRQSEKSLEAEAGSVVRYLTLHVVGERAGFWTGRTRTRNQLELRHRVRLRSVASTRKSCVNQDEWSRPKNDGEGKGVNDKGSASLICPPSYYSAQG